MTDKPHNGISANLIFKIGARVVYYHYAGTFFEVPKVFPAALADINGYILFRTKEEFYCFPNVSIGKKTNIKKGISKLDGYIKVI